MNGVFRALLVACATLAAIPARAHVGDHTGLDWAGLIQHIFETDHLIFAGIAAAAAFIAYRAGRHAGIRSMKRTSSTRNEATNDPR